MKRSNKPKSFHLLGWLISPWQTWLAGATLVLLVAIVYWRTLDNGFVWDDSLDVTNNAAIRSLQGLSNIWFQFGTLSQYYPLTHSTFWVEYHLWGLDPRGYHIVNGLLHAMTAVLVWRLLLRLSLPGAWLAAAIFAVHPVEVESVAWVSERKNLLSCLLAVGSLLAYLRFSPAAAPAAIDPQVPAARGSWLAYAVAFVLYVAALLAKTVAASVPAVLLVIYWWKRGRVTWRDVARIAPFFVVGLALSLVTIRMEKTLGASGEEWDFSLVDRVLIAGRALWFYAGKLLWPHPLIFYYPRWVIDTQRWWQYLFPVAAVSVVVLLWRARTRIGRGPLAAVLIFAGVLVPALGFVNIFIFRYSFVADHFQYHASIALISLAAGAAVLVARRLPSQMRWLGPVAGAGLLLPLAVVAQQRTLVYQNNTALVKDLVTQDPQSWLAHHNLGVWLQEVRKYDEALSHFRQAIEIREQLVRDIPTVSKYQDDLAAYYVDVGLLQRERGRPAEAESEFRTAIEIREKLVRDHPHVSDYQDGLAWCYVDLAFTQHETGRPAEAVVSHRKALEIRVKLARDNPTIGKYKNTVAASYADVGLLQRELGRAAEAASEFGQAIEIREKLVRDDPTVNDYQEGLAWCHVYLALAQQKMGEPAEAADSHLKAIEIREKLTQNNPAVSKYQNDVAVSYRDLGNLLRATGRTAEAVAADRAAVEIREKLLRNDPTDAACRSNLANDLALCGDTLATLGQWSESADRYARAVAIGDHSWQTMGLLALVQLAAGDKAGYRATCADLVRRHAGNAAPDAALSIALALVMGEKALEDMNQALALARRAADADPSNPIGAIVLGAAQFRTGRGNQAMTTLTRALSQLDPAAPTTRSKPDEMLVGRLVGEMLLALAYHEHSDREGLQKQLETLRTWIDKAETSKPQYQSGLPPWAVGFSVEIAGRELARLSQPDEVPRSGI